MPLEINHHRSRPAGVAARVAPVAGETPGPAAHDGLARGGPSMSAMDCANRRLAIDFEATIASAESRLFFASVQLGMCRLARA